MHNMIHDKVNQIRGYVSFSLGLAAAANLSPLCQKYYATYQACLAGILAALDAALQEAYDIVTPIIGTLPGVVPAVPGIDCDSINPIDLLEKLIASKQAANQLQQLALKIADIDKQRAACNKNWGHCNSGGDPWHPPMA